MTFRRRKTGMILFSATVILFMLACARTSVDSSRILEDGLNLPQPHLVLVQDYDVGADSVELDGSIGSKLVRSVSGKDSLAEQLELGKATAKSMSEQLAANIQKLGLAAERSSGPLPEDGGPYLVIRGELLSVDEGNRLRRFVIGLGAGGTEVAARTLVVMLSDGKETPVEEFTVTAKSGRTPGAAVSLGAGAAVGSLTSAAVVSGVQHAATAVGAKVSNTIGPSVQADGARGAKAIAKELTKLFRARDWISPTEP